LVGDATSGTKILAGFFSFMAANATAVP
jgi:hypothetical protein